MTTVSQLTKYGRKKRYKRKRAPALKGCPQKLGTCSKVYIIPPKKPNSAKRKVARVVVSAKNSFITYIPGEGHNIREYSRVLVRGGRVKDLPGVKYKVIRGKYDASPLVSRSQGRSKHGRIKLTEDEKNKKRTLNAELKGRSKKPKYRLVTPEEIRESNK